MAKKVILKDQNDIEVLPITRGELVLDASGNPALHSTQFLATDSQPGLMSSEDKYKLDHLEESGPGANNKVAQINTTTDDVYRLLFSETADDTDRTEKSRKSANLTFNPSTGVLNLTGTINANGGTISGNLYIGDSNNTSWMPIRFRRNNIVTFIGQGPESFDVGFDNGYLTVGPDKLKYIKSTQQQYDILHSGNYSSYAFRLKTDNYGDVLSSEYNIAGYGTESNGFITYGPVIRFGNPSGYYNQDIQAVAGENKLFSRAVKDGVPTGWKEIAFTDSDITGNASTADKLKNKVKIWGQDFDGSSDISGGLSGVTSINSDGSIVLIGGATNNYSGSRLHTKGFIESTDGYKINALDVLRRKTDELAVGQETTVYASLPTSVYGTIVKLKYSTDRVTGLILNSSGNVGIGTTDPKYKLHVNGNVSALRGIFGKVLVNKGYGNNVGDQTIETSDEGMMLYLQYYHNGGINLCQGGGKVGIGTTNPLYKLDVNGTIYTNSQVVSSYFMAGPGVEGLYMATKAISWHDANYAYKSSLIAFTSNSISLQKNTSCEGTLSVTGTGTFNSQIISNVTDGTAPLTVVSTTKVENLNADRLDGYDSTDIMRIGTWNTVDNQGGNLIIPFDGKANPINSSEHLYGSVLQWTAYQKSTPGVSNNSWYYQLWGATSYDRLYFRKRTNTGSWSKAQALAFTSDIPTITDYYWANVLISKTSSEKTTPTFGGLTVNGNSRLDGQNYIISFSPYYTDNWSDGTNSHPWYGYDHRYSNTGVYSTTLSDYFGMTLRTGGGYICMTQVGNVGIGTTAPSTKFHVLGSSKNFDIPVGLTENSATGNSWYAVHAFTNPEMSTNEYAAILIGKKNNLKNVGHLSFFYAGDSSDNNRFALGFRDVVDLLVVKANGNVGILTSSPYAPLSVNGHVHIGNSSYTLSSPWKSGLVVGPDGTDKIVATYLASATNGATVGAHNSALSAWAPLHLGGTNIQFRVNESLKMMLTTEGQLAILKTGAATSSGLVVGGDSSKSNINTAVADQTAMIQIVAGAGGNTNSTAIGFHNPGISSAVLEYKNTAAQVGGFNFKSDDTTWGVGIGTTMPSERLHVVGNMYTTGSATIGNGDSNKTIYLNGSTSSLRMFAWDSSTYIESGNKDFSGNMPLYITGYSGNNGSNLYINFYNTQVRGVLHVKQDTVSGNYNEGIRLYGTSKSGSWANIQFGCDPSKENAAHADQWLIGRDTSNNFVIRRYDLTPHMTFTKAGSVDIVVPTTISTCDHSLKIFRGYNYHPCLADSAGRPGISISGNYPYLWLTGGGTSNANHGATITLAAPDTAGSTNGNLKTWTFGIAGQNATWMDLAYSVNTTNPHNGINKVTCNGSGWSRVMRWNANPAQVIIDGNGTDSNGSLIVNSARTGTWIYGASFFAPSISKGHNVWINIGKANSTKNSFGLSWYHAGGDGSSANYGAVHIWGYQDMQRWYADGHSEVVGTLYATHFYESSDQRLKENIQAILNKDNMPQIKEFDWKESGEHSYGLIAQELEEQGYSELVSTKDDGYKTVNYSAALSLIVGKLQVKIKELEKEIEILKNK